jgi:hypothetical protein
MPDSSEKEKSEAEKLLQYWQQSRLTIDKFDNLIYEYTSTILSVVVAAVSALTSLLAATLGKNLGASLLVGVGLVLVFIGGIAIVLLGNSLVNARMNYTLMGGAIETTKDLERRIFPTPETSPFQLTRRIEEKVKWETQMKRRSWYYALLIVMVVLITASAEAVIIQLL